MAAENAPADVPANGSDGAEAPEVNVGRRYLLIGATAALSGSRRHVRGGAVREVLGAKRQGPRRRRTDSGRHITLVTRRNAGTHPGMARPARVHRRPRLGCRWNVSKQDNPDLADPASENPERQPEYARNPWRSREAEVGVYLGICTHLGCSPK